MPIVFSAEALADLRAIRNYIADHNPAAADRIARALVAACEGLKLFPHRGRPGSLPGTRELVTVRPYIIVYRVRADKVEIARVWHSAQGSRP